MNDMTRETEALIRMALAEDVGSGDVTSTVIFDGTEPCEARIIAKDEGIFCGGRLLAAVYAELDSAVVCTPAVAEGARVTRGTVVATVVGPARSVLIGERTALNFLQRLCGISTATSRIVSLVRGTGIQILDTRKTAPGFRLLDKYAVKMGGGTNHRMGLFDMVMIKDNHIEAAGSIGAAVARVREAHGRTYPVEVEARTIAEVDDAIEAGADIIMLDNMDDAMLAEAIRLIDGRARIEVSGNMDEERIARIKHLRIDYISIGSLTHSVRAFDLSMKFS